MNDEIPEWVRYRVAAAFMFGLSAGFIISALTLMLILGGKG